MADEKKTGHTPGPWKTDQFSEYVQADGVLVADLARSQAATREANARLIAAAPEMADALAFAADALREYGEAPATLRAVLGALRNAGVLP